MAPLGAGRGSGRGRSRRVDEPADRDLGPPADPESVARTIVLTKLTGHARSRHELAEALAARNVPPEVTTTVLDRFEAVGLVDDSAFAAEFVRSRRASRGLSRRALAYELRRKGVGDEVVTECLAGVGTEEEEAGARRLVDKRLRPTRHLAREARFRRLTGALARKGYPSALAMRVVREAIAADEAAQGLPADDLQEVVREDFGLE